MRWVVPDARSSACARGSCQQGCALKILTDNTTSAKAIAEFGRAQGEAFEVLIEIDCDGHRVAALEPLVARA
jgi:D-serine deaminase-like pyridoxal phosphate-dependent protein